MGSRMGNPLRHGGHAARGTSATGTEEDDALPFDWGRHAVTVDGAVSLAAVRVRTRIFIREEA